MRASSLRKGKKMAGSDPCGHRSGLKPRPCGLLYAYQKAASSNSINGLAPAAMVMNRLFVCGSSLVM